VQDLIQAEAPQIYTMVVHDRGHFYVCGDCTMAEDVYQTLKQIIQTHSQMTDKEVEAYMLSLRVRLSCIILFLLLATYVYSCDFKYTIMHLNCFAALDDSFRMKIAIMKTYLV